MSESIRERPYRIAFLRLEEVLRDPKLLAEWERRATAGANPYALYQSPAWCETLAPVPEGERLAVAVATAADGSIAGIVPLQTARQPLEFKIAGLRLGTARPRTAMIRGGEPMLNDDDALREEFVRSALSEFSECDAISFQFGAPANSPWWQGFSGSAAVLRHCRLYLPDAKPTFHFLRMPASFDGYLQRFKSKTRYNLHRQVTRWEELCGGIDLFRAESPEDVQTFFDGAATVMAGARMAQTPRGEYDDSPQGRRRYAELAKRGHFRSYLLRHGGKTCAFVLGFQHADVYYYARIGFSEEYEKHSPGAVLLYLLLDDLFKNRKPALVNFYSGNWWYKKLFATDHVAAVQPLLVSRNPRSRLVVAAHSGFRALLRAGRPLRRLKSLAAYWKAHGVRAAFGHALFRLSESGYERYFGIRSSAVIELAEVGITNQRFSECRATDYLTIRTTLNHLCVRPGVDVLIDFGAGAGRVLVMAGTRPFKKVIGVEFVPSFADTARENVRRAQRRLRCKDVEVVTTDSRVYAIPPDATIFYVYNAFSGDILASVLGNIRTSILEHPRQHTIVYIRPPAQGEGWMGEQSWLRKKEAFQSLKAMEVFFYEVAS